MVGVPRSKGCRICVQRRVKCDQTRPFCNNCKKGNRPCPGYGQDMKFQDEGPKLRQRYDNKALGEGDESPSDGWDRASSSNSTASIRSGSQTLLNKWDFAGVDIQKGGSVAFGWLEAAPYASVLRDDDDEDSPGSSQECWKTLPSGGQLNFDYPFEMTKLSNLVFSPDIEQRQLLYTFASSVSPGDSAGMAPAMRHHGRWLSHLPPLTGLHPLLDTAVRAVTLAHLGRLYNLESFQNESRPYYGKALRLLNAALLDEEKGMASETLSATILLSFYEMFSSESNESWVRHAGGAGTLMRIRGPARHRYGFDREIFLAFRHALIIEAFQNDTASFLDAPEWREVSEQIHEDIRASGLVNERLEIFDSANAFFNEMVKIPGLMCDSRNLLDRAKMFGSKEAAKADVITRATQHRNTLKSIFVRFSAGLRNLGHAPTSYVSGDPVISIYYQYVNIFIASSHTGYWSLLILLNLLLRELDPTGEKAGLYQMENREAALDCCRSEPYMETSSFLGPFFVIFALRLALAVLEPLHEREWVIKKLFHIGNTGMSMAKHLPPFTQAKPLPRVSDAAAAIDAMEESDCS